METFAPVRFKVLDIHLVTVDQSFDRFFVRVSVGLKNELQERSIAILDDLLQGGREQDIEQIIRAGVRYFKQFIQSGGYFSGWRECDGFHIFEKGEPG